MTYLLIEYQQQKCRIGIDAFPITIGRDPANSIVLQDAKASRFHLKIKKNLSTVVAHDLDSRNGTCLNGKKIKNAPIKNHDQLLIGNTTLTFINTVNLAENIANTLLLGLNNVTKLPEKNFQHHRQEINQLLKQCETSAVYQQVQKECVKLLSFNKLEKVAMKICLYAKKILPTCEAAMFFHWDADHQHLFPVTQKHWGKKNDFKVSSKWLAQAINRRQAILSYSERENITILPVLLYGKTPVALLQIEHQQIEQHAIAALQMLLQRSASHIQMLSLTDTLNRWSISMINSITKTIEEKDTYTMGHSERVRKHVGGIASVLELDEITTKNLEASALCHDVGKIGIPDNILKKSTMLDNAEYEEMKLHPVIGAEVVSHLPNSKNFVSGILYHHERWNGTGYPEGLAGEKIPFFARIIAVADSFDAMVSGRSYSGFIPPKEAIAKLLRETDIYDPEILKAFAQAYDCEKINLKSNTLIQKI